MTEVTLAAANMRVTHDKDQNLKHILDIIDEAASKRVDILVLPEMGLQGYADFAFGRGSVESARQKQYYYRNAEAIPGPATDRVREALNHSKMVVQLGLAESALHGNVIYNSVALIGSEGVVGIYRKLHNQDEFPYFCAGEDIPVFKTPHAQIGSMICYDLCFPELPRTYALRGAEVLLLSTAWSMRDHDRAADYYGWAMDLAMQSNAFFNQIWLVSSNHCEKGVYSQRKDYYGGSQIVDPYGKVVAYLGDEEGLVIHRADLRQKVLTSRTQGFFGLNLLQDRRPEHYSALVDQGFKYPMAMLARKVDSTTGSIVEVTSVT